MVKQKLEKDKFDEWGRKLALAVQQLLVDKLPDDLEPNVSLDTNGSVEDGTFAYAVHVTVKKHDGSRSGSYSTAYIFADKLIVDPKDYGVGNVNRMTLGQAADTIADCMAGNLSVTLEESKLKNALAAGAIAVSAMTGGSAPKPPTYIPQAEHESDLKRLSFKNFSKQHDARAKELAKVITDKYSVGSDMALVVAKLAMKYEKPTFPKAEDILAVCGIESSFKPHAVSSLKNDPAVGLMQVRPAIWKLNKQKLKSSVEEQIKTGSEILHGYYQKLKTKEAALQAFNVGITNYMQKKGLNPRYVPKFHNEREMYEGLAGDARKALLALQQMFSDFDDFDTELVHLEAGNGYRDRYRMKIHAPWADLWVDLDSEPSEWQKVSFGAGNRLGGGNTNETYGFHSEADLLDFVKKQYNRYITIKMGANAPMGLSGRRVDWQKYFLK